MTSEDVTLAAEKIIVAGNGYAVPVAELLKLPAADRARVWREIVRLGAIQDNQEETS